MKLILHTTTDHFSEFGYHYFKNLYGFDPESVPDKIIFKQTASPSSENNFSTIHGWILIDTIKIPSFQIPTDLNGTGKPLLFFTNDQGTYPCAVETDDSIIVSFDFCYHLGFCISGNLENVWKNHEDLRCKLITISIHRLLRSLFCLV